jgi:hypothetical protein
MANTHRPLQTRNYLTTQPGTNYVSHVFMNVSSLFLDIGPEEAAAAAEAAVAVVAAFVAAPPPPDECSTQPKMA